MMSDTAAFVSTFHAKEGFESLLLDELQRLVTYTRQENSCLFCDLFRVSHDSKDKTAFVIHSVWSGPNVWLNRNGWPTHPAIMGQVNQCLQSPIEVIALEALEEVA